MCAKLGQVEVRSEGLKDEVLKGMKGGSTCTCRTVNILGTCTTRSGESWFTIYCNTHITSHPSAGI